MSKEATLKDLYAAAVKYRKASDMWDQGDVVGDHNKVLIAEEEMSEARDLFAETAGLMDLEEDDA